LNSDYRHYIHQETGHKLLRKMEYSLPSALKDHVSLVGPTTRFPQPSSVMKEVSKPDEKDYTNFPDNLRALYSVNDVMGGKSQINIQAVTAFLSQHYAADDLRQFFDEQFPDGGTTPIKLVGDETNGKGGIESMLDIEYMPALGALNPTEFWGFSGTSPENSEDEPFRSHLCSALVMERMRPRKYHLITRIVLMSNS
jgi:tripeptidyl-peptidase-1